MQTVKRQEQNFTAASKLAKKQAARYEAYMAIVMGKRKNLAEESLKCIRNWLEKFRAELTGDEDFYKLIGYMGTMPEKYVADYKESYNRAANRLVREFANSFCREDGRITGRNWLNLIRGD